MDLGFFPKIFFFPGMGGNRAGFVCLFVFFLIFGFAYIALENILLDL